MKRRWIALLLALSALACSGCGGNNPTEDDAPKPAKVTREPLQPSDEDDDPPPAPEVLPPEEDETVPTEPAEQKLMWCTDPVLTDAEMPGNYRGLELPVEGATGYTSVDLPLWSSQDDWAEARQALDDWKLAQEAAAAAQPEPVLPDDASGQDAPPSDSGVSPVPADAGLLSAGEDPGEAEIEDTAPPPDGEPEPAPEDEAPPPPEEETTGEPGPEPEPEPENPPDAAEPAPADPEVTLPPEGEPEEPIPPEPEEPEHVPTATDGALAILPAGTAMTVLMEDGDWWLVSCEAEYTTMEGNVETGEVIGWVAHRYCMINLPDVIPSIVYNATNAYESRFVSCNQEIPGITGEQLYSGPARNDRLGQVIFMMPVLYSMAPHLCAAQRAALAEGNTLVLYEGYRPLETQLQVAGALQKLMNKNTDIKAALSAKPWSISWFIATSTSNHQMGYAVDVNLARVSEVELRRSGTYTYTQVTAFEEYEMPTPIHELSPAAAIFTQAIGPNSDTAWRSATRTDTFAASESAIGLQGYCTGAGLSPLASEWWHFNDLASRASILDNPGSGGFMITTCRSTVPQER